MRHPYFKVLNACFDSITLSIFEKDSCTQCIVGLFTDSLKVPLTMYVSHCQTSFCGRFTFNNFGQEPHLEFVLFSVKLFYCRASKQARISGCYVKYANSALSQLHIRQQLWKKQNHFSSTSFHEAL